MTSPEGPRRARPRVAVLVGAFVLAVAGIAAVLAGTGQLGGPGPSGDAGTVPSAGSAAGSAPSPSPEPLPVDRLLLATEVARSLPGRTWRVVGTDDNTRGSGLRWACQQARYADPAGLAALVRTTAAEGVPLHRIVQAVERSRSRVSARAAYDREVGWFAGCRAARLQLVRTWRVDGLGGRATLMSFGRAGDPPTQLVVGVVQNQDLTSTLVLRQDGSATVPPGQAAHLLTQAARRLCPEDTPRCVSSTHVRTVAPPPSGETPGTLGVVDLPPVGGVTEPWFGVDPVTARRPNPARSPCDTADLSGPEVARAFSRTYLIPDAPLPPRFGLTQTVATFRTPLAASRFTAGVRAAVSGCDERELAVTVTPGPDVGGGPTERASWTLDTELTEDQAVRLRVGLVRTGRHVAQLTFAPSEADDMTDAQFDALLVRAGERLGELGR